jgi:hypothetical protein
MNVGDVLDTVEQTLLSRQLSSLERFILCQSWFGRGYSEMAPDCAYSIAHLKDIGSQLWQALSKAIGQRVTKKNLFLVLKQYLLSPTGETVANEQLSVTFSFVEVIDPPLTPTLNQLPVASESVETSYSDDSEQLPPKSDRFALPRRGNRPTALLFETLRERASYGRRCPSLRDAFSSPAATALQTRTGDRFSVVTEESSQLERAQQEYQTSTDNTEAENNLKVPITRSEQKIPSASLPLDSPLYINDLKRCIIFCPNFPTSPNFPTFLNNRFNLLIE